MDVGPGNRHVQNDLERLIDDPVTVDDRGRRVGSVRDAGDMGAHQPLGTGFQLGDRGIDGLDAVPIEQLGQPSLTDAQRAELGADVADALLGDPDVVQYDVYDVLANLAAADEFDRWQAQPLLHDLGRSRRKAARHHAAGIRPVAGIRQVAPQAAAVIERPHHLDIHQVGAAEIRIVDQDHVARFEVAAALYNRLGG